MKRIDKQICSEIYTNPEVKNVHETLCLEYQGRFSGSRNCNRAAEFIEEKLVSYGLNTVRRDLFDMILWYRCDAHLSLLHPNQRNYPAIALPYAPACDSELPLIDLNTGHPEDIERAGKKIKGAAVLVDDRNPPGTPNMHRLQKYIKILKAGASAFLFVQDSEGMLAPTGSLAFNHNEYLEQAIPSLGLAREIGDELRYYARKENARIRIQLNNTLRPGQEQNIIGELHGQDKDDFIIQICAHYDGHDIAQGALDNASGTAAVLEIARVLAPMKDRLRGTIRFVLYSAEEMGLVGSHTDAHRQKSQLAKYRMIYNLDCVGTSGPLCIMVQHQKDLIPVLHDFSNSMPSDIKIIPHFVPFSDHFPFFLRGIPCAFCATQNLVQGRGWGHTIADTWDKVSVETLHRVSSQMARIVARTSLTDHWPACYHEPHAVKEIIDPYQLEELMRYEEHWPFTE